MAAVIEPDTVFRRGVVEPAEDLAAAIEPDTVFRRGVVEPAEAYLRVVGARALPAAPLDTVFRRGASKPAAVVLQIVGRWAPTAAVSVSNTIFRRGAFKPASVERCGLALGIAVRHREGDGRVRERGRGCDRRRGVGWAPRLRGAGGRRRGLLRRWHCRDRVFVF